MSRELRDLVRQVGNKGFVRSTYSTKTPAARIEELLPRGYAE